ncbi:hypothetical protein O1611_g7842 [Lasiodiplodia mahajangana]|uniref:Uncharacterized protein n=1 Tax=Lasiodiplodia mahajangana TaxID=1108764 RepID=A0ACC2JE35_9PEZI|nr:hypothetical protein O1611_g7842 [Lasiodiplodia mahajangana]
MDSYNHFGSSLPKLVYDSDSTSTSTSVRIPSSPTGEDSPQPTSPMTSKMFEVDRSLDTSETPEASEPEQAMRLALEDKFKTLLDEFKTRVDGGFNDYEEWNNYLRKELGSRENSRAYHQWARKQLEPKPPPDSSLVALAKSIPFANWIHGNDPTTHLNSVIRHTYRLRILEVQDLQCRYDDFRLGLKVGGRPLIPPPTEEDVIDAYRVDRISPGYIFGIRYARLDNGENQDLLVAPLGRIVFKPMASNDGKDWLDPGLALVVNILKDGTAANLLIVSAAGNYRDEDDEGGPVPTKLPGLPKFTVAQLDQTIGLIPQSQNDVDQNIRDKLKIESISMPIIAEAGASFITRSPVPVVMFPLNNVGQESAVIEN